MDGVEKIGVMQESMVAEARANVHALKSEPGLSFVCRHDESDEMKGQGRPAAGLLESRPGILHRFLYFICVFIAGGAIYSPPMSLAAEDKTETSTSSRGEDERRLDIGFRRPLSHRQTESVAEEIA
ncbi:hypothetical protein Nepgr_010274 [Nepenthes gracilis]|uniref:Uncharacterized protein n=1 Tax=Nepenthes gracilis TaxID=150966 RepID=A0AAD3SD24_NEPGR|nr:hypothetical protein Nepgr_010274 [Nepenthes gracilis]